MINATFNLEMPCNEEIREYKPGSQEAASLKAKLAEMAANPVEIPIIIGGREVRTGRIKEIRSPHDHNLLLGTYHTAGAEEVDLAIKASQEAWKDWSETAPHDRMSIFLKMAELLAGPWRDTINAATMLGQSKTAYQAEIDSACELIDFYRFNPYYALTKVYSEQPMSGIPSKMWNYLDHRPLEGFVFAITPFNFTSIAGNLPTSPAMMGNVCVWKPGSTAVLSGYYLMKMFEEAGLPAGVINFIPGPGGTVGNPVMASPLLAGIHFTGSTAVFHNVWKTIGTNIASYRTYPRIVGETGGKDFCVAHESADLDALVTASLRGAFEYQGQKCSAQSRMYVPKSIYPQFKQMLLDQVATIKMGDTRDFSNFMGAVIDEASFDNIAGYIARAKSDPGASIIAGGNPDKSKGWFIEPTVIECSDPKYKTMEDELFGPVLSIHPYDGSFLDACALCNDTSEYALTGSIFARDRYVITAGMKALRHACGNFYINDKPTGAVVGQQPFGGSRASGTNDKAGSVLNLVRWVSPRAVKENFVPPTEYRYPHMG